ncbi:MAG: FecR domain-containing protein [Rhodocyclaceae bacterium]
MNRTFFRLAALFALAGTASASTAAQDFLPYTVRPGDTLYALAERYLDGSARWPLLARINRLNNPDLLTPGTTIRLPLDALRSTRVNVAVDYLRGNVTLIPSGGTRRALAVDDRPGEGDTLEVGPASYVRLRLPDGSALQLQAGAQLRLQRLREMSAADLSQTVVYLERGRVDSRVQPQRKGSRFDVITPLASAGVRGTRFGVSLPESGAMVSDVTEGHVVVSDAHDKNDADVFAGQGAVISATGAVSVRALPAAPEPADWPERIEQFPATLPMQAQPGVVRWHVNVAEDADLSRIVQAADEAHAMIAGVPDGRYYVGVRAVDGDGLASPTTVRTVLVKTTPVPPLLQSPAGDVVVARGKVPLQCTDVPGVQGYVLQVSHTRDFAQARQTTQRGPACRFDITAAEEGDYYWRVAATEEDSAGTSDRGPFSVGAHFVSRTRPPMPQPDSEHDGRAVRVYWAGEPGQRFVLEVRGTPGDGPTIKRLEVSEPQARLELPPRCSPYYVRLQAVSADGLRSDFSPPRILRTPPVVCSGDGEPVSTTGGPLSRDP